MKKITSVILVLCMSLTAFSYAGEDTPEQIMIKEVILAAYVDGLQNKGDLSLTESGFHPGFNLLGVNNNSLTKWPIYSWIEYAKAKKEKDPAPLAEEDLTTCKFLFVDVTGNAAVAKIELHKHGKHIFTDYLSLYKFNEGWRVVNKIYHRVPDPDKDK